MRTGKVRGNVRGVLCMSWVTQQPYVLFDRMGAKAFHTQQLALCASSKLAPMSLQLTAHK